MKAEEYCQNWRQARVFLSRKINHTAFLEFHRSITKTAFQNQSTPFFVTHYVVDSKDPNTDNADTDIRKLPKECIDSKQLHWSIRIRFKETEQAEESLKHTLANTPYWYSDFRDFNLVDGLADGRFCDHSGKTKREKRAMIIAEMLHNSSRLMIDSLRSTLEGESYLETTTNDLNKFLDGSPYRSVIHMLANGSLFIDESVERQNQDGTSQKGVFIYANPSLPRANLTKA